MESEIRTKVISFKVRETEYELIAELAEANRKSPGDWCRDVALERVKTDDGFSKNERILYEELCRIRFLMGHGFRLAASRKLTVEEWNKKRVEAYTDIKQIADRLLAQHLTGE